jgi:adenylate cyclase
MSDPARVPVEIERKFLVRGEGWRDGAQPCAIRQGYLARSDEVVVRVRIADREATLTIKGRARGITAPEFEYLIPTDHAESLLTMCEAAIIEKTRYRVDCEGHTWEVDVFSGANTGLVLAEIELETEDEAFARPDWLGFEVTHDPRFKNVRLSLEPFRDDWID